MTDQGSTNATAAELRETLTQRGRELAATMTEASEALSEKAAEAWRDSAPARAEALRAARQASGEAAAWGSRTWSSRLRPALRDLWNRRTAALAAAGMAIPAGRELAEDAAVRLGLKRKAEQRHWGAFFIGLLIGAATGIVVALLTAPKAGEETRTELATTARETAGKARETAEKVNARVKATAGKVKEAATQAAAQASADWVPIFQRGGETTELAAEEESSS